MGAWASVILGAIGAGIGSICGPIGTAAGLLIGASVGGGLGNDKKIPDFLLDVKRRKKTFDGSIEAVEVFDVQFKGAIVAPKAKAEVDFILFSRDCTGGKSFENADVVATSEPDLSSIEHGVLSPVITDTLPYEANEYNEWTTIFNIPVDCCVFPYRGSREIEFRLVVKDKKNNILASASTKISVQVYEIGYLDYINLMEESEKIVLKIIHILVFTNSKYFSSNVSDVITAWIKSRSELRDTDSDKDKIRQSLAATFTKMKNSTEPVRVSSAVSLARDLSENIQTADKYAFMEFFLSVMASFENISTDDFELIDLISREMGLDDKVYQEAKHKYLSVHDIDESNAFAALGISKSLSLKEKKQKLNDLFLKWNSLAVHKDPVMREKAEKMLNLIADCKKQLSRY